MIVTYVRLVVGAVQALAMVTAVPTGMAAGAPAQVPDRNDAHASIGIGGGLALAEENPTNDTDDGDDDPYEWCPDDLDLDGDGIGGELADDCAPVAVSGDDGSHPVGVDLVENYAGRAAELGTARDDQHVGGVGPPRADISVHDLVSVERPFVLGR